METSTVRKLGRVLGRITASLAGLWAAFSISLVGLVLLLAGGVLAHQSLNRGFGLKVKLGDVFGVYRRVVGVMAAKS